MSAVEWVRARTEPEPNTGCWLWAKGMSGEGYGVTRHPATQEICKAHRVVFDLLVGTIPKGLLVCHRCDVKLCVNPDHLFLGTSQDNAQDMLRKGREGPNMQPRTHCFRGHEFTPDNTYEYFNPRRELVIRSCRICLRASMRRYFALHPRRKAA